MNTASFTGSRLAVLLLLTAPLAAAAGGVPLRVDRARSYVDIAVKATVGSFTGHLRTFTARITTNPAGTRVETAAFHCEFVAIDTDNAGRNRDMNAWQETRRFPHVSFALTSLAPAGDGRLTATGLLQLHGVRRIIRFPVTISSAGGRMIIDGAATLDTHDFGLPIIRKFLVLSVNPVVHVRFHLEGEVPGKGY